MGSRLQKGKETSRQDFWDADPTKGRLGSHEILDMTNGNVFRVSISPINI